MLRRSQTLATVAVIVLGIASHGPASARAPDAPRAVGPFLDGALPRRTPMAPAGAKWKVVDAFPRLPITNALVIASNPADTRLYVGSQEGHVVSFENEPSVTHAEPFMDLRDRVAVVNEGGLLGLVFHPEFGRKGSPYERSFYAYYTARCPLDTERDDVDLGSCTASFPTRGATGFYRIWLRLSRFEARWDAAAKVWRGDAASEEPMLSIRLYNYGHRGGGLLFGADRRLYLAIGDQARSETAQEISRTLEGGVLRMDVDVNEHPDGSWSCAPGSHAPRRRFQDVSAAPDELSGRLYCIPDDNPWLDATGGRFEEYFSIGHRNPYALSLDPQTGRLWSAEVGHVDREEINLIEKGGNYGWPFREGFKRGPGARPAVLLGTLTEPVIDLARSESTALIGGFVYRGARLPELRGRYVAGDHVTRNLWAFTLDERTMTATKERLASFEPGMLSAFGRDHRGELLMGSIAEGAPLQRLERIGEAVPDPPALLSELGAFRNLETLEPHPAALAYEVVPAWADGAEARRWLFLPNDGAHDTPAERIAVAQDGSWRFPIGSVLMQQLELPSDERNPSRTTRLETRFLVLGEDERWYGLGYRWRDDGSDAALLSGAETRDVQIRRADGGAFEQTWPFPSRDQCLICHDPAGGGALGVRAHQLERGALETWSARGMLDPAPTPAEIAVLPAAARLDDAGAPLELRARSWLDANCAYCHRPESGLRTPFDARLTTPLPLQGLVWGEALDDLGIASAQLIHPGDPDASVVVRRVATLGREAMPRVAHSRSDAQALAVLSEWVRSIPPSFPRRGLAYEYHEVKNMMMLPDFDALTPSFVGSTIGFDPSPRTREDDFAFRFRGLVEVPSDGRWTFHTTSDDGSQLFVDGRLVVDNDGVHVPRERSGEVTLEAGFHDIVVTWFERNGDESLSVAWQGPGVAKQPIPPERLFRERPPPERREVRLPGWLPGIGLGLAALVLGRVWLRRRTRAG